MCTAPDGRVTEVSRLACCLPAWYSGISWTPGTDRSQMPTSAIWPLKNVAVPGEAVFGAWDPAAPAEARSWFEPAGTPWWIAGGFALELVAGRSWRTHGDLDVLVLRRDQLVVQEALAGREWWAADPPGTLRPWAAGEILGPAVHDVRCRPSGSSPWRVQVMLDETDGDEWVSRRSPAVRRPVAGLGVTVGGIPCLRPEIQLFWKAGSPREKDEEDFREVAGSLGPAQRSWLARAIGATYSRRHPWLARLREAGGAGRSGAAG
ncbi:amino acid transporter [Amycolatopsis mongoliensis]|uniref:Amino acid transporter n=1 Tax=Amycolatopsis mongoliensis TaxID=715475 RepID=A0A9Y2JKQ3_9PSEU|nr:amino acid transporter [Amycolatopsis sp. 4-36]WIX99181.1 amino acid transporter [Amycolatopsis sp. 4-36]